MRYLRQPIIGSATIATREPVGDMEMKISEPFVVGFLIVSP